MKGSTKGVNSKVVKERENIPCNKKMIPSWARKGWKKRDDPFLAQEGMKKWDDPFLAQEGMENEMIPSWARKGWKNKMIHSWLMKGWCTFCGHLNFCRRGLPFEYLHFLEDIHPRSSLHGPGRDHFLLTHGGEIIPSWARKGWKNEMIHSWLRKGWKNKIIPSWARKGLPTLWIGNWISERRKVPIIMCSERVA